jgi:primosomal protein N''
MEKFQSLKALVATAETEAEKFYNKGNGAAGTRLRKTLQEIKTTAQAIRNEVTEKKSK